MTLVVPDPFSNPDHQKYIIPVPFQLTTEHIDEAAPMYPCKLDTLAPALLL